MLFNAGCGRDIPGATAKKRKLAIDIFNTWATPDANVAPAANVALAAVVESET